MKRKRKRIVRKPLTKRRKFSRQYLVGGSFGKTLVPKYRLRAKKIRVKRTKSGFEVEGFDDLKIQ